MNTKQQRNCGRRDFIKKASIGGLLSLSIPQIVSAALPKNEMAKISVSPGSTILFQGDSITDAGRNRDEKSANNGSALGGGYAFLAAANLLCEHAEKDLKVYNKGISGNKVYQLAERWQSDCLDIKPDVLSILIGVNDFWHKFNGNYDGTVKVYKEDYKKLLDRTFKALPNVKLIICEPFAVNNVKAVNDKWYPDFDAYRQASRDIADEYDAAFVPYQQVFNKAQNHAPGKYWTHDGVHPSIAGAQLMAEAWLKIAKI